VNSQTTELLEKIRQQFDSAPYPKTPIMQSPKEDADGLFIHNFLTPFYIRNQQLVDSQDLTILDVGCGSGYKSLVLAEANPGATIVGIDISENSTELARERLHFHGFTDAQFFALPVAEVAQLGLQFDYINCDEVLYLMPDLVQTLKTLKSVLKPTGILRGNLHSAYQRQHFFRAQKLFKWMGLMQDNPEETEINVVLDTLKALKDETSLKQHTWNPKRAEDNPEEYVLMNYLFQGDKGYTIADLFSALRGANLEFICMLNQRDWDLMALFQNPQTLPMFWEASLPQLSIEDRLQVFEFISPIHRLLDFWCGHTGQTQAWQLPQSWKPEVWNTVRVHLHPQLRTESAKAALNEAVGKQREFELNRHLIASAPSSAQVLLSPFLASALLPLWDAPQPFPALVDRILKVRPFDPVTLTPTDPEQASHDLRDSLLHLEGNLHILLEPV
jgi:2-polyprenyl-3-methyl-5-hydroxy-6-metoxy-1,4-benzoquinol methylase